MSFTQPAIAGANYLVGQTANTYTAFSFGCKAFKDNTTGSFTLTFDKPLPLGSFIVEATPVAANAAAGISPVVVTPVDAGSGVVQVTILTVNDAHAAVDCGLMVTVTSIPVQD